MNKNEKLNREKFKEKVTSKFSNHMKDIFHRFFSRQSVLFTASIFLCDI